jgi:hypothetical protein
VCAFDRRVPCAKPRADVEGGRTAIADDDVVCVGVVFAPRSNDAQCIVGCTSSVYSRVLHWMESVHIDAIWLCMYFHFIAHSGGHSKHLYITSSRTY